MEYLIVGNKRYKVEDVQMVFDSRIEGEVIEEVIEEDE